MYRYFIKLAYNGARYHGWQIQQGVITVQEELNRAISLLLKEEVNLTGCGRTDTGVHAREFYAHFDVEKEFDPQQIAFKLNAFLPRDIVIYWIEKVRPEANARFDAVSRTYEYRICRKKDPFENEFSYNLFVELDLDLMNKGSKMLLNYKDFECFSKVKTCVNNFLCDIYSAEWKTEGHILTFTITANRFLRNMVRAIAGTLLELGQHKITLEDIDRIILSKDRGEAGTSVPAKGLFLSRVSYPDQ